MKFWILSCRETCFPCCWLSLLLTFFFFSPVTKCPFHSCSSNFLALLLFFSFFARQDRWNPWFCHVYLDGFTTTPPPIFLKWEKKLFFPGLIFLVLFPPSLFSDKAEVKFLIPVALVKSSSAAALAAASVEVCEFVCVWLCIYIAAAIGCCVCWGVCVSVSVFVYVHCYCPCRCVCWGVWVCVCVFVYLHCCCPCRCVCRSVCVCLFIYIAAALAAACAEVCECMCVCLCKYVLMMLQAAVACGICVQDERAGSVCMFCACTYICVCICFHTMHACVYKYI